MQGACDGHDDDDDGKSVVTLREVLEQQPQALVDALNEEAVYGLAAFGRRVKLDSCTYAEGPQYQTINLCRTCTASSGRTVAVCVGCSLACHVDHDILELWAKPDIRCDCGTGDLAACRLRFEAPSAPLNDANRYEPRHNFESLFCWCRSAYNYEKDTTMIQCAVCTDWFHEKCIGNDAGVQLTDELLDDDHCFVCRECCVPSLAAYEQRLLWRPNELVTDADIQAAANGHEKHGECLAPATPATRSGFSAFWKGSLRDEICRCAQCVDTYRKEGIANLLLAVPEGHDDSDDDDDDGMDDADALDTDAHLTVAVSALPHTEQIRAATAYDDLREAMRSMIAKSLSGGRREIGMEDVDAFKADLARRKRRKGDDE